MAPTKIRFHISCRGIAKRDFFTKPDLLILVFTKNTQNEWVQLDRTNVERGKQEVDFRKCIDHSYHFEKIQHLLFVLIDVAESGSELLGCVETTVGELVVEGTLRSSLSNLPKESIFLELKQYKAKSINCESKLIIRTEEIGTQDILLIRFNLIWKNPPSWLTNLVFFKIITEDGLVLYKSEKRRGYKSAVVWNTFKIGSTLFDEKVKILIKRKVLGVSQDIDCISFDRSILEDEKLFLSDGTAMHLKLFQQIPSFFHAIQKKTWSIDFLVGIDFTQSNGNPRDERSIHFFEDNRLNVYEKIIVEAMNVLKPYGLNTDISAYGFGGILPDGKTSHVFCLKTLTDLTQSGLMINTIKDEHELVLCYRRNLYQIALSGPTMFSPIIQHVCSAMSSSTDKFKDKYSILFIITDGQMDDYHKTVDAIINSSNLPLSIVVIGVGPNQDFGKLSSWSHSENILLESLSDSKKKASRCNIQFVRTSEYSTIEDLISAVFEVIPGQFLNYQFMRIEKKK